MNTWQFDENGELRFTSDSDLELEKVNLWIQRQEIAIRTAVINEFITRENNITLTPEQLTAEQHIKNAIDKIDEIINEVPC